MTPKRRDREGFTLIEVVIASVIAALVAGGTMMAFLLAVRLSKREIANESEATFYAQQTVERFRNRVACDDPWFGGNCVASPGITGQSDPLPSGTPLANLPPASREYEFVPGDLDGNGAFDDFDGDGVPDYYLMRAKVQWGP